MTEKPDATVSTPWPDGAPERAFYLFFTKDTPEEAAARRFEEREGEPPEWVFERLGYLWVGPLRMEESCRRLNS